MPARVTALSPLFARPGRWLRAARRRLRLALAGERREHFFDLTDTELVARALGAQPSGNGDAARGELLYELRDDLRIHFPLGLTPAQRGAFLQWFAQHGWDAIPTQPLDLLAYLLELDAAPDRGLVATYLVQPEWQAAQPDALTPAGWGPFKQWITAKFGVRSGWLRRAPFPTSYRRPAATA